MISVSPQTRASLAVHYGLTAAQTLRRLITLFKGLGADYVFDTSFSREFSLLESMGEFIARHRTGGPLPVLASACPGWVCYAEKTHGTEAPPALVRFPPVLLDRIYVCVLS